MGQDRGEVSSQGKYKLVWGGGKGRILEKDEEGVDCCGPRNIWEEEVLGEFSGWVQKVSDLEPTHHRGSREDPGGGGTQGAHYY